MKYYVIKFSDETVRDGYFSSYGEAHNYAESFSTDEKFEIEVWSSYEKYVERCGIYEHF